MRKTSTLLMVAILLTGLLAGCAGSNKADEGKNTEANQGTKQAKAKDVKLNIMLTNQGRFKDQFDQYLAQFAKKELAEKNIKVAYNLELPSDKNLIKTRLASGDAPDIYSLHATFDGPTFEKGGYLPDLSKEPFAAKLFDNVRSVATINGKVFGVPMESFSWSYLYNKGIFDKYGLKPPTTLTEMKQVVATLKSNNVTPFMLPFKDISFPGWVLQLGMSAIAAKQVPDWWDRMSKGEGSLNELKDRGMFDIVDLVNANGTDRALEVGKDDGVAKFAKGEAAMLITGPWYADSILKVTPDFKLGLAALPVNDDPKNSMVMLAVSTVLTVYPKSPNKDVAIDFLNYLLDDQDSSAFFEKLKFNKLATNQKIETFPWTAEGTKYIESGLTYRDQAIPNAANEALGKLGQNYYAKQITQKQLIEEVDKTWKKSVEVSK